MKKLLFGIALFVAVFSLTENVNATCPFPSLDACLDAAAGTFADCAFETGTDESRDCTGERDIDYAICREMCEETATTSTTQQGFPLLVSGGGASSTGGTAPVTLTNPLGTTDIRLLIARVISAVLSIIGVIALLMFVYGGFLWMISGGNEGQVEKGKEVLKWTTLGIILIVSAYVIVNAIFRAAFTGAL